MVGFRRAGGRCPEHETSDGKGSGDITGSHNMVYVNPANFVKCPLCKPNFVKRRLCKLKCARRNAGS